MSPRYRVPEEERKPCIYIAWSKTTSKAYIGQSRLGIHQRQRRHKVDYQKITKTPNKFYQAIRELGWDDFQWETLFLVWEDLSSIALQKLLNEKEIEFIEKFNSIEEGYNSALGGSGVPVRYETPEGVKIAKKQRKKKRLSNPEKRKEYNNRKVKERHKREELDPKGEALKRYTYKQNHKQERINRRNKRIAKDPELWRTIRKLQQKAREAADPEKYLKLKQISYAKKNARRRTEEYRAKRRERRKKHDTSF